MPADPLRDCSVGDVLREHRRSRPHHLAVVDGDLRSSYRELDDRVNRVASVLAGLGVGRDRPVVWFGQTRHRVLELFLAAGKLGALFCPANWRLAADELRHVIADLDPAVVVWQSEEVGGVAEAVRADSGSAAWIRHDADGPDGYEGRLAAASSEDPGEHVEPERGLLVLYTGAFEGRPHGAVLDHRALLHQALVIALAGHLDESHVFLNSGPLFHVATWMWALPTFVLGGTNVYVRRADAEEICRLVERERCTGAFLVPPTIDRIVELNADGRYDLSSLRAPEGRSEWNAMVTADESPLGRRRGGYGQTEVGGLAVLAAFAPTAEGGAGRPAPLVQARVVDPDGREVPVGGTGEITLRGPTVARGFHARPELDRERTRSGWWHTGDLGRREEDGSLSFVGPATRLIKSAAENIYPAEVEACIRSHPAVSDCAVIGVPDPVWGQRVKAIVVTRGTEGTEVDEVEEVDEVDEVDEAAIVEHCRERIASYKKPAVVEFAEELPRRGGALDEDALDERYGGGGYPGERGGG